MPATTTRLQRGNPMQLRYRFILLACLLLSLPGATADALEQGFRNPPHSAGIRAFWWWLNGNVTREAITRDPRR